jgi:hypothetical protein
MLFYFFFFFFLFYDGRKPYWTYTSSYRSAIRGARTGESRDISAWSAIRTSAVLLRR